MIVPPSRADTLALLPGGLPAWILPLSGAPSGALTALNQAPQPFAELFVLTAQSDSLRLSQPSRTAARPSRIFDTGFLLPEALKTSALLPLAGLNALAAGFAFSREAPYTALTPSPGIESLPPALPQQGNLWLLFSPQAKIPVQYNTPPRAYRLRAALKQSPRPQPEARPVRRDRPLQRPLRSGLTFLSSIWRALTPVRAKA